MNITPPLFASQFAPDDDEFEDIDGPLAED